MRGQIFYSMGVQLRMTGFDLAFHLLLLYHKGYHGNQLNYQNRHRVKRLVHSLLALVQIFALSLTTHQKLAVAYKMLGVFQTLHSFLDLKIGRLRSLDF